MPIAYQDQDGKWWKECSSTKQLFGPVDSLEELSEWFNKDSRTSDLLRSENKQCQITYYENNKEKQNQQRIIRYHANKNKETKKGQIYYQNNKHKIIERDKRYRETPMGMLTKYKSSAKRREINFTLTLQWFEEQMIKPEFNFCYYSGIKFVDESSHAFSRSLDRISSTKGYTPDNVRWVCFKLNSWKSDLTLDEVAIMFNAMAKHHNVDPFEVLKKVA